MKKNTLSDEKKFEQVFIELNGETPKKPAFAFFNRVVNLKHVQLINERMKLKGYRASEVIHIIEAKEAKEKFGIEEFVDINGNLIPDDEIENYYLVIEGQHRTIACSLYNEWLSKQGEDQINIPAIKVDLRNGESITEYSNEISYTKKEWSKEDYLQGSANIWRDEHLLQRYNELIKTEDNKKGYSLSTLNLIYCNSSGLSRSDFILLCSGVKEKGKRKTKKIIPGYDIEIGDKFIETCRKVGFRESEIAKRYIITSFNKLRNSRGGADFALKVLSSITRDDITIMTNEYGNLDEDAVQKRFEILALRLRNSETDEQNKIESEG